MEIRATRQTIRRCVVIGPQSIHNLTNFSFGQPVLKCDTHIACCSPTAGFTTYF